MSLSLGKSFNRSYTMRIPFLSGNYDIETFFNKRSPFLLFGIKPDFSNNLDISNNGIKINMFKNLESSKFCETFINLHNFRRSTLDISNQFESIKNECFSDVSYILNETLILAKHTIEDKDIFDQLNLYGLTMTSYTNEFIFIIAERHNIIKKLNKKVVRTTGLQISTSNSMGMLNEYHEDFKNHVKNKDIINNYNVDNNKTINLSDVNKMFEVKK